MKAITKTKIIRLRHQQANCQVHTFPFYISKENKCFKQSSNHYILRTELGMSRDRAVQGRQKIPLLCYWQVFSKGKLLL